MSDIFDDVEKLIAEENSRKSQEETSSVEADAMTFEASAEIASNDEEQIFNESELEDIMAEIESLENDFSSPVEEKEVIELEAKTEDQEKSFIDEVPTSEELKFDSSKANKTDLQKEIEKEIALIDEKLINSSVEVEIAPTTELIAASTNDIVGVKEEIPELDSTILAFDKKVTPAMSETSAPVEKREMSFTATGNMSFIMNLNVGSEVAKLFIDETKGLVINMSGVEVCLNDLSGCTVTMDNGINFNIPLTAKENSSKKKSA